MHRLPFLIMAFTITLRPPNPELQRCGGAAQTTTTGWRVRVKVSCVPPASSSPSWCDFVQGRPPRVPRFHCPTLGLPQSFHVRYKNNNTIILDVAAAADLHKEGSVREGAKSLLPAPP
jgi:hypothetical protein